MKKITLLFIALILILGFVGYYFIAGVPNAPLDSARTTQFKQAEEKSIDDAVSAGSADSNLPVDKNHKQTEPDPTAAEQAASAGTTSGTTSTTTTTTAVQGKIFTVSYQNNSFTPSTVEINVGDTVTFVNNHTATTRIASNPHPGHTSYPALDSGMLAPGQRYSIAFRGAVTVGYHNHLNPTVMGNIIVK